LSLSSSSSFLNLCAFASLREFYLFFRLFIGLEFGFHQEGFARKCGHASD